MKLTGFSILASVLATMSAAMSAALLAAPVAAQRSTTSLEGFQLPPSPQQTPQVQGPVTDGIALPRAPRPSPSASPTPAPTASATPAPAPAPASTPASTASPAQAPPPATPAPRTAPAATPSPSGTASQPVSAAPPRNSGNAAGATATQAVPQAHPTSPASIPEPGRQAQATSDARAPAPGFSPSLTQSPATAEPIPARPTVSNDTNSHWWAWLIAGFILAWLSGGLFWLYRQRHESGGRMIAPPIERPRPKPSPRPDTTDQSAKLPAAAALPDKEPAPAAPEAEAVFPPDCALRCTLEATRFSLTLMNATLSYRLTLANDSGASIRDIIIGGDLVTAHSSLPIDQQIAEPGQALQRQHHIPLLLPDQNAQLSGEFRLPIPAIHALRRKNSVMFVPLLRLRIDAQDMDQIALQTLVIGQSPAGPGAGLRPFRLDLGPRIYGDIGHRPLAPHA